MVIMLININNMLKRKLTIKLWGTNKESGNRSKSKWKNKKKFKIKSKNPSTHKKWNNLKFPLLLQLLRKNQLLLSQKW